MIFNLICFLNFENEKGLKFSSMQVQSFEPNIKLYRISSHITMTAFHPSDTSGSSDNDDDNDDDHSHNDDEKGEAEVDNNHIVGVLISP